MSAWSRARRKLNKENQRLISAAGLRPRKSALLDASRRIVRPEAIPQRPYASKTIGEKHATATRARLHQTGYARSFSYSFSRAERPSSDCDVYVERLTAWDVDLQVRLA